MNKTFNALLLCVIILCIFDLRGSNVSSQQPSFKDLEDEWVSLKNFEGEWFFEKAEYLERTSLNQDYVVKYEIKNPEGFDNLASCLHYAAKRISINQITQVVCPFASFCGHGHIVTVNEPKGDRYLLVIGADAEELDTETPIPGLFYNITGLDYWIEWIDDETIALTKEAYCIENEVGTYSAVRSILKKNI